MKTDTPLRFAMLFLSVLWLAAMLLTATARGAEPEKSLQDMILERGKLYAEIEAYKKEDKTNIDALEKAPAMVEFRAKQKILQEKWQKAQAALSQLNEKIADKVSKESK